MRALEPKGLGPLARRANCIVGIWPGDGSPFAQTRGTGERDVGEATDKAGERDRVSATWPRSGGRLVGGQGWGNPPCAFACVTV